MGISRDSWHKRFKTGAVRPIPSKKKKSELGRPSANTKIGAHRVHLVRAYGGNVKQRALRLDTGNFSLASEHATRKTRICDVIYNATSNELVRSKTLVRGSIVSLDAAPFRQCRQPGAVDALLEGQFATGRLLARVCSRPGQVGQASGYVLEGPELEFYIRKIQSKKSK